jgi:hypothetical protein
MANNLKHASVLLVQAFTYEYESVDAGFDLTGASPAFDKVFRECQN